ncbi:hypothetical protein [Marinimicrobium sp. ARAG 43.8]|uniref:hypothetical protein n=1 Tax=Marinimicrobium sp. ARAG 43.8 TaxID=3418719 RepID=UPI003CF012A9
MPIADSHVSVKAPGHSPADRFPDQVRLLPGEDLLHNHELISDDSSGDTTAEQWGTLTGLRRSWAFWGPWLSGCKGELRLSISVVGRQPSHELSNLSFFNPTAFEMVLVHYLNDLYGHSIWEGLQPETPRWHGPMDWQQHHHLPVFSASFNIYGRGEDLPGKTEADRLNIGGSQPDQLFVFPITDQHFVKVVFKQHIYSKDEQRKPLFDTSPIQTLQDAIFNSLTLKLSPEAQASYDKVKAEHRNMQLSKEFAPLKWPTPAYEPGSRYRIQPG